jgi:hypothetical protein
MAFGEAKGWDVEGIPMVSSRAPESGVGFGVETQPYVEAWWVRGRARDNVMTEYTPRIRL